MASAGAIYLPGMMFSSSNFTVTNFAITTSTSACEYIFNTPEAITITRLGFRYGARALTPPAHIISLQGVDASGNPDGTIKGGGTPASHVFTPPADTTWDGTWRWQTLDNAFTTTRGAFYAIVIAYSSGTVSGTNNSSFTVTTNLRAAIQGLPYAIQNLTGTRTRQTSPPVFGYASAGTAYGYFPYQSAYTTAITASTTPDEQAMAFSLPSGSGTTYKVRGVRLAYEGPAASSVVLNLYSGTTVLQTVTLDSDTQSVATNANFTDVFFSDTNLAALNYGTTYRVGLQPVGTTGSFRLRGMTMAAAADLAAWPGGTNFYLSTRTDAGAWTDDTTTRPFMDLIIDDMTAVAGGVMTHPGMSGGMRG